MAYDNNDGNCDDYDNGDEYVYDDDEGNSQSNDNSLSHRI